MIPSFFPPSEDKAKALKLERCMRMLPQDQDTGGFFVAVLVKTGPILWQVIGPPTQLCTPVSFFQVHTWHEVCERWRIDRLRVRRP